MILGIDEVGRGPWAGPLVVGAVVLGKDKIDGLTDSKKLTAKKREVLCREILASDAAVGLGWVHADELDVLGLSRSLEEATKRAVSEIKVPYHEIIIDGTVNFLAGTSKGQYVTTLKKADLLITSVSAASIAAKVARDEFMQQQAVLYPKYGFESHVGYGTAAHRLAIEKYGVTPLHRLSFAPLAKYKDSSLAKAVDDLKQVTTKQIGDKAEDTVALYLQQEGHEILERNWKTKFCEIDIVSSKNNTVYFTEVKYRKDERAGGGMAAITSKKLRQMTFAAEYFALKHKLKEVDLRLAAADVSTDQFVLGTWIPVDK